MPLRFPGGRGPVRGVGVGETRGVPLGVGRGVRSGVSVGITLGVAFGVGLGVAVGVGVFTFELMFTVGMLLRFTGGSDTLELKLKLESNPFVFTFMFMFGGFVFTWMFDVWPPRDSAQNSRAPKPIAARVPRMVSATTLPV